MSVLQALVLGIIQGLTEFIPVSSSGHLLITQKAMGISETGFVFDVALHLGTLGALLIFFNKDLITLSRSLFTKARQSKLAWLLVMATIPAAVIGYLLESSAESHFRSPILVAVNLGIFGLVMLLAEAFAKRYKSKKKIDDITKKEALVMGFAQAAAIVPGVSRSGSTITAGLFAGVDRVSATRFSFLLGIPITLGATLKVLVTQSALSQISQDKSVFIIGVLAAFVTGILAIKFMLNFLGKHSLATFAYYRFILAAVVIAVVVAN